MRKSYRLVILLVLAVAVGAGALQARLEKNRALEQRRAELANAAMGLQDSVAANLEAGRPKRLLRTLRKFVARQAGAAAIVCEAGRGVAAAGGAPNLAALCSDPTLMPGGASDEASEEPRFSILKAGGRPALVYARRVEAEEPPGRSWSLFLARPLEDLDVAARDAFFHVVMAVLGLALIGFVVFQFFTRWIIARSTRVLVRWVRAIFHHPAPAEALRAPDRRLPSEFHALTRELSTLALRTRQERLKLVWDARQGLLADGDSRLNTKVLEVLRGRRLVIVANREPYLHEKRDGKVTVVRPASGVVTALEPIMRLCGGGVWVGHGSGDHDREVVDSNDEVRVPPENPTYTLRRVWLSKAEEDGYYYGFSNEGMWPLCHLAYTRPTFRLGDWEMYKSVNQKFCDATLRGLDAGNAIILVQDYHYALLPQMLRERAPEALIELFWHIPWPNPEAFGICPQYKELLKGMLGADVVGFHTQFHCNNFLETCDRYLECRVDWERFSVTIGNRETLVRSYPISIAAEPVRAVTTARRAELRARYGVTTELVAVGVDRLDYTKGLVERVNGVERFLEKYPEYIGRLSFIEMGTPSRTTIASYRALIAEVEGAIARVNARFGREGYQPIVLLKGCFDWSEVADFYQLGDVCLVTSLHDGMNLVAKEYVWSQRPEHGALILSRFTGAARELSEAFIVNPYSSEEIADALYQALNLTVEERTSRMQRMKDKVSGHNAFHWATDLLAGVNAKA